MMSSCFKWRYKWCDCSIKALGLVYGWMGVIWRTVFTMFLAVILSRTSYYDPNIYDIVLITLLTYIQVALVANLFFLIGIQKEKQYFMLPYIVIGGMELFFGVLIFIFGIILLRAMWMAYLLWSFIPISLSITGIYLYFWIKSIQLYREMEREIVRKNEENARIATIRQSLVQ